NRPCKRAFPRCWSSESSSKPAELRESVPLSCRRFLRWSRRRTVFTVRREHFRDHLFERTLLHTDVIDRITGQQRGQNLGNLLPRDFDPCAGRTQLNHPAEPLEIGGDFAFRELQIDD